MKKSKAGNKKVASTTKNIVSPASNNLSFSNASLQFGIVAIGASAGGLEAMTELLRNLPSDTGMAFIYVQHLNPEHKSMLTEILSTATGMIVQEIDDIYKIQPDHVYVIPHNKVIEVADDYLKIFPRPDNSSSVSIDILFTSLAMSLKERVIGILLSGSGGDGSRGIRDIKLQGGLTFAQNDTAKFDSMPLSAISTGIIDYVLSPKQMAEELVRLSAHPLVRSINKGSEVDIIENDDPDLQRILYHILKVTAVDFSTYKMNPIKRRIIRRMIKHNLKTLAEYAAFLDKDREEIELLYKDLLINVTSFFRDTDSHTYLQSTLFPAMLNSKSKNEPLRIWVPACATGEEVYSIAMLLIELRDKKNYNHPVQIFGTDINLESITKARTGIYSKSEMESITPKRMQRFFSNTKVGYRINKTVREMCVFAPHNLLKDQPFSRLDFISCSNLFIYLNSTAQKNALINFHYALHKDGYLMLGKSEDISAAPHLFVAKSSTLRIFAKHEYSADHSLKLDAPLTKYAATEHEPIDSLNTINPVNQGKRLQRNKLSLDHAINAALASHFMTVSVVINHELEILQFRGSTERYFTHAPGRASFHLFKMARPEIAFELRSAISSVIKTGNEGRKREAKMIVNGAQVNVKIEVIPLKVEWDEPLLLISFSEHKIVQEALSDIQDIKLNPADKNSSIKKLEEKLAAVQAEATALAQKQDAYASDLQSANEEAILSYEELQTLNKELEASKAEIESVNEELRTTNEELQSRNELLNEAYEYSEAVITTIHDPMLILDKHLRVKAANKKFYKNFRVSEEDTEGIFVYELGNGQWNIPKLRSLLEDIINSNAYIYNYEVTHHFKHIGDKIMLLNASRIIQKAHREQLILLVIEDITHLRMKNEELKQREKKLREMTLRQQSLEKIKLEKAVAERTKQLQKLNKSLLLSEERYHRMVDEVQDYAILFLNKKGIIRNWNAGAEKIQGYQEEEAIGKSFTMFYTEEDRLRKLPEHLLNAALKNGKSNHEGWRVRKDNTRFWGSVVITALHDENNKIIGFSKVTRDLTDRKNAEDAIREVNEQLKKRNLDLQKMNKELESFSYVTSHDLQEPLRKIQTFAGRIMDKEFQNLGETGKDYFPRIQNAANRMQSLILDLLSFSRLNTAERKYEKTGLGAIIEDVKRDLRERIAEKGAIIEVHGDMEFKMIPFQFGQLMQNLISNALKFSKPEVPNHIKICIESIDGSKLSRTKQPLHPKYCHISITDNGIGFEAQYSEKIFEVFQKLHRKDEYAGTGIGLAIVKKIVENHHGSITATSELGRGATFDIYIPAY